ncbi:MAG: ATP-grasp domain-containing protein [Lachnospiraceae bacterium]
MKALVMAGGLPQIELIRQLKARGIFTILADGSAEPLARPYADKVKQIDIFDIDAVSELARKEKVDFLITVCADQVLLVVAQVSEMLGLPCYIDYQTAILVSNKTKMKEVFLSNNIPTSKFTVSRYFEKNMIDDLKFPLVVKPVDAYSSKGVRRANNFRELEKYYADAQQISRDSKDVIIEEFFEGEEISVDVFVSNGKVTVLSVTNSMKIFDNGRFVIYRGKYPAVTSEVILQKIDRVAQQIADAFHIKDAPMLIQLIASDTDISVIEFCARTGGNMKYLLIRHICGVDVISAVIDITLGITPEIHLNKAENQYIVNDFIYCREGVFDHLEGFEEMLQQGYISDYHQIRPNGFIVHGITSSSDRVVGITVQADSVEEFNRKHEYAIQHIAVIDPNGIDIMRHDLLPGIES